MKILLVEDSKGDALLIKEYLAESFIDIDYHLTHTERLSEAIEIMQSEIINIVLLDLGLPDSFGLDTFRKLYHIIPDIPVIILTGLDDEEASFLSVKEGAQDYLVKGNINPYVLRKAIKYAIERKKAYLQIEELSRFPSENPNPVIRLSDDCFLLYANASAHVLLEECGCSVGGIAPPFMCDIVKDSFSNGNVTIVENQINKSTWFMTVVPIAESNYVNIYCTDITQQKQAEKKVQKANEELVKEIIERQKYEDNLKLFTTILGHLNRKNDWENLISDILAEVKAFTGFDAIGIRLRKGNDFPYFVHEGFDDAFIEKENHLCRYDKLGNIILDSNGNPYLECMCGNIITGRTDTSQAFFTENGSFWSNSTTQLLASTTEEDRQARTRNRCNGEGYESVALIPLKFEEDIIGLLQLNDKQENKFTLEFIEFFEEIADAIGIAYKRMKTEEKIKESEERYRSVTQSANEAIVTIDNKGTIIDWNNGAETIFGYRLEEIVGEKVELIIPQDFKSQHSKGLERVELGGDYNVVGHTVELAGIHKSGNEFPLELSLSVWETSKGTFYTGIIRDITDRWKADHELIEAKEIAEEMNRLKTNFLANMSHELRTPMVGILGFSQMLIGTDDLDLVNEFAPLINSSGKRLMETLNLILDLSRIESGKTGVNYVEIDLYDEVMGHIDISQSAAKFKGLTLSFNSDSKNIPFLTDRSAIKAIINNLLSNAIKFTSEGEVNVSLFKEEYNNREWIVIEVQDTGIGIKEESIDSIFFEFRQESEGLGRSYEGIGLGLTLIKKYIDLLGGSISVESKFGVGSTFTVKLPVLINENIVAEDNLSEKNIIAEGKEIVLENEYNKILFVEDDQVNLELIKIYLGNQYDFDYAMNGLESIEKAKNNKYTLILMDINLGVGMTGVEAMKEIKKIDAYNDVPIVAITAYAMDRDEEKFLSLGFDYYIAKPFIKDEFIELIRNILSK